MCSKSNKFSDVAIDGVCAKGFEPVKEMFLENFVLGSEEKAQVCIYLGNKCVVDLYGDASGTTNYGPDMFHVSRLSFLCINCLKYCNLNEGIKLMFIKI